MLTGTRQNFNHNEIKLSSKCDTQTDKFTTMVIYF